MWSRSPSVKRSMNSSATALRASMAIIRTTPGILALKLKESSKVVPHMARSEMEVSIMNPVPGVFPRMEARSMRPRATPVSWRAVDHATLGPIHATTV